MQSLPVDTRNDDQPGSGPISGLVAKHPTPVRADHSADATEELDLSGGLPDLDGEDELTIRRDFAPHSPTKLAVEISDADATWKWKPRGGAADAAGRRVGLALPTLDGDKALEWDRDDVEKTLERATPFDLEALRNGAIPLARKRRVRPRPVESTAQIMASIAPERRAPWALAIFVVVMAGVVSYVLARPTGTRVVIGSAPPVVEKPLPVDPASVTLPKTGTIITTLEGKGRSVSVDGKVVGTGGQSIVVSCGAHVVRVGGGVAQTVDVPCGGELPVAP